MKRKWDRFLRILGIVVLIFAFETASVCAEGIVAGTDMQSGTGDNQVIADEESAESVASEDYDESGNAENTENAENTQDDENGEEAEPADDDANESESEEHENVQDEPEEGDDSEEDVPEPVNDNFAVPITQSAESGDLNNTLNFGTALAYIAEQEFIENENKPCGEKYWGDHQFCMWAVDFVEWCAERLGFVGEKELFGPKTSTPGQAVYHLIDRGAMVYYPGDGVIPQSGDLVVWWCADGPGTAQSVSNAGAAVSMGIVTGGTGDSVTLIQGDMGSWVTSESGLMKITQKLDQPLFGRVYIMMFLRPDYPSIVTANQRDVIQKLLIHMLYGGEGGQISCDFDGYQSIEGRHEGIDFCKGKGSNLYSLTDGEVIRVRSGATSEELSVICVYNALLDKTVIYLHAEPAESLAAGMQIKRGTYLGVESDQGTELAHTHVEVADGVSYSAKISVGDSILENENPYQFWSALISWIVIENADYYRNKEALEWLGETVNRPDALLPRWFVNTIKRTYTMDSEQVLWIREYLEKLGCEGDTLVAATKYWVKAIYGVSVQG